ncbi:histone-lysine N-methyltransferase 2B-like isoform X2 [Myxocyprinus asiaticus]|uniref:histone-lysine N-methyltransferase 2B-like isoform X2 n=1 Tax=Myxocyprinus asiaticus TaxID=70543 RepID=UPI002221B329|nr:histone-lysine N-methyltransferase 2B-like isoform X2 [Myxocyprinus asiaticus]
MAAAGGGLPASAVLAGINTSATVRCRFPGRPCMSRNLLRTEKRSNVGRLWAEDRKEQRPVDFGATLREDPSLSRLLRLAEKHRRQSEAGFCTSGSDEETDFTGFKVDRRSMRSGQGSSNGPLKLAGKSSLPEKPDMKVRKFSKNDQKSARPKMVVKMAAKIMTKKGAEQVKWPSVGRDGHLKQGSSSKTNSRLLRGQREADNENGVDKAFKQLEDKGKTGRSKRCDSSAPESRTRHRKIVWALTLIKSKEQASKLRGTQHLRSPTENAKALETNQYHRKRTTNIAGSERAGAISPKPVGKQRRVHRSASPEAGTEAGQEPVLSPDREAGTSLSDSLCSSRKKPFVKRRKCFYGRRRIPKQEKRQSNDSQEQASCMPRKRPRLGYANAYTTVHHAQEQPLGVVGEMKKCGSGGQAKQPNHSARAIVSARSSRVIKVPKRFMDDERMSALPEKGSPKKAASTEIPVDPGRINIDLIQTQKSGNRLKTLQEPLMLNNAEKSILEMGKSHRGKPVLSSSGLTGGPRGRGGRHSQAMDHCKIYCKLKRLTASLTKRRMQRVASASSRVMSEDSGASPYTEVTVDSGRRRKSDLNMQNLYSPGVVPKLTINLGERSNQSTFASLAVGYDPAKENETSNLQGTNDQRAEDAQAMAEHSGATYRINTSGAKKRMFHLLKRAKVQLIKIDQQKQLKSTQLLFGSVRARDRSVAIIKSGQRRGKGIVKSNTEGAPQEHLIGGPRIKHVCRAAAVALGQPRAMVPDDIPRLSALPLHEREGITASPAEEDVPSHSEPESEGSVDQKPTFRRRYESAVFGNRLKRCLRCKGCNRLVDCGRCVFCLDKPKFGGPNKKRQSCILKKCSVIEQNKLRRFNKVQMKRHRSSAASGIYSSEEENEEGGAEGTFSPTRRQPRRQVTPQCYRKLLEYGDSDTDTQSVSSEKTKASLTPKTQSSDMATSVTAPEEAAKQKKQGLYRAFWAQSRIDKSAGEHTQASVLTPLAIGFTQKGKLPQGTTNKIRVDFKEDCHIQNVWLMGGLSILTSVPIMPQSVCLLCASKGQHDMIYCQMCCEPFHQFCLAPDDCPKEENKENWCCRRCKFCHVCGRKSKQGKPVLQCKKCMYCYHPACLGPTYPKPVKLNTSWTCMLCIRCKSCGVTPGKSLDMSWNHELNLCPDCTKLHSKGNFCTVCLKCYEENEFDSTMMQCARCAHWVHPKCEGLTDDLYEILCPLRGKSLVFSCAACSKRYCSGWQDVVQEVLKNGLVKIMNGLKSSPTSYHLLICAQCEACPDMEIIKEQSGCCLHPVEQKLQKNLYTTLKAFHEDVATVMVERLKKEESLIEEQRPTCRAKQYYIKLVEQVFSWFKSQDPKTWNSHIQVFPSGMLPEAVIPPSDEHSYAQWLKEQDRTIIRPEGSPENPQSHDPQKVNSFVDERQCSFCPQPGDAKPNDAGRLLYIGQNEWAHVNCCVWSAEVQEVKGALLHVHSAVARGRCMRCEHCGQTGATVGCCLSSCQSNYHFMCARASNCVFQSDKKVYCYKHRDLINNKIEQGNGFEVLRRVYVDFDGISLRRKFLTGLEPESVNVMIGSLHVKKLGVLTELSENCGKLYPVGYQCSRWYWSTVDPRRRCRYTCKVTEVRPSTQCKTSNSLLDQGENQTIVHSPKSHNDEDGTYSEPFSPEPPPSTPSKTKQDLGAGGKTPGYPHSRRPAGGMSRPLPSPGNVVSTSHHILTISDLDETRRVTRRLSTRSRNASPPLAILPGPVTVRSVGTGHPRSLSFSPPVSPLGLTENHMSSTSPRRKGRPSSLSPSSVTSRPSPPQVTLRSPSSALPLSPCLSPRLQQPLKITPGPQDLSPSEPVEVAGVPSHRISLTATISDKSDQELLPAFFDPDTDVAVASILNAKLEFNEALLNENVALHCDPQGVEGDTDEIRDGEYEFENSLSGVTQVGAGQKDLPCPTTSEMQMEADSADQDSGHYLNFSRTVVVCEVAKDSAQVGLTVCPNSGSISQLDGADNDSESDASEANIEDDSQEVGNNFRSRDTEPSKCTGSNKDRTLGNGQLVCTLSSISANPCTTDSVDQNSELENSERQTMDQVCEEQDFQEITYLHEIGNLLVDSSTGVSNQQEAAFTEGLKEHEMTATTPNVYKGSDLFTSEEEVLMDNESTDSSKEVFLDDTSGNFISAVDGMTLERTENAADREEACDSSSANSLNSNGFDLKDTASLKKPVAVAPSSSTRKINIITPARHTQRRLINIQPVSQPQALQMAVSVGSSLPLSMPVNVVSSSPGMCVTSQGTPLVSGPVVMNGFGALPKGTTKGRTIAIRIATPKQVKEHSLPQCFPCMPPSPQVLLVNRAGQILVKNPQTNTYQIASANSPSYTQISQIAKMIHSGNILQRPVPKVTVMPVPQAQASLGKSPPTHIISYSNREATPSTQVLIQRIPQSDTGSHLLGISQHIEKTVVVKTKNTSISEGGQKQLAQAIIDKAMASHRDISPSLLTPSKIQVFPHLNKHLSTDSSKSSPGIHRRTQPNILSHSRPQVKIKRVSSTNNQIGVKKCKTDFLDQTDPSSQDDLLRSNRVRIKAPSVKDALDFDDPDVDDPNVRSLEQPKNEFKVVEQKRVSQKELGPTATQGSDIRDSGNLSSKHGENSDWAPYAGWSSDEDFPSPSKLDKCYSQYQHHLRFQITSEDGFSIEAESMDVAWKAVMDGVQEARIGCRLEHLPFSRVNGARVLGVLHDAVLFLLEQLQGASLCRKHSFRFHQHEQQEEELPINPSGCARAEVYDRKSTFDMFNFLASQHRQLPESRPCDDEEDDVLLKSSRRATSTELPMAMRFRHLEKTSKEAVGVYRSDIHGRGLFCKRNIEAGEMVIEYAGNVIRSVLTDKREKYYDSKGIGCYMFRIDDFDVVDATMHGNAARFINHSCDPNCYSRVINVEGQKHIVIFALRKIYRGEELTYDYKFPIEDASNKLNCNCGARRCRRFLN